MDEWYDSEDQWVDEGRCVVCKVNVGYSSDLVCSATCADLLGLRENDCYA